MKSLKKLFILGIILGISICSNAGLKSKQVIGEWKSSMIVSNTEMTGSLIFYEKSGELQGEYIPSEGTKSNISKIKINKKKQYSLFSDSAGNRYSN
jgi:predicted small secreted protein